MTASLATNLKSRRLAIFERVKARRAASGQPVQEDAPFLELVERWAEGRIELDEVLKGYRRSATQAAHPEPNDIPTPAAQIKGDDAELLADLERVIGMVDLTETRAET